MISGLSKISIYFFLKSGLTCLKTLTPIWPVRRNIANGLTYWEILAIAFIHMGTGVSDLFVGFSGKPHGSHKSKARTFCGYLMAYDADRYPPNEWPNNIMPSFRPISLRQSSIDSTNCCSATIGSVLKFGRLDRPKPCKSIFNNYFWLVFVVFFLNSAYPIDQRHKTDFSRWVHQHYESTWLWRHKIHALINRDYRLNITHFLSFFFTVRRLRIN